MIERCERMIPETIEVYWKASDDKEFNSEEDAKSHELKCEEYLKQKKAFKGVRKDSIGYWPQNTAIRGNGYQYVFASNDSVRDWLVQNEGLVMNFFKRLENSE